MNPLVIDVEGDSEGHVFNYEHKMYLLGLYNGKQRWQFPIEWFPNKPYGHHLQEAQKIIDDHDLVIAFNLKHDLLWSRRYGLNFQKHKLWCLQYGEFCASGQTWRMPDLDTASKARGGEGKISWDWSKPFNTYPWEQAAEYNARDLRVEYDLFQRQVTYLKDKPQLKKLIWHGSQDLGVTAEMEWNGLKYDHRRSLEEGNRRLLEVCELTSKLQSLIPVKPPINWESPKQVSAALFGGTITYTESEEYDFTYADARKGTVKKRRKVERANVLPRLTEPLNGTKNANGFSTEEGVLLRLKPHGLAKDIIEVLLQIRGLNKLVDTYYHGIPKLSVEMGWQSDLIHGQLNHCVTQTGRLSSSRPNQQNLEHGVRECLVTRFPVVLNKK